MEFKKGDIYGTHRVIEPKGVLPQPADVVDNNMEIFDNEVLIDVHTLNIDSASFTEIERRAGGDTAEIEKIILNIVETTGKSQSLRYILRKLCVNTTLEQNSLTLDVNLVDVRSYLKYFIYAKRCK